MKYMFWSVVLISKACGLLIASSAPLIDRHLFTSMMPRGCVLCRRVHVRGGEEGEVGRRKKQAAAAAGRGFHERCQLAMSVLLTGPTISDLNQKILPSLRMNHLRREEGGGAGRRGAGSTVLVAARYRQLPLAGRLPAALLQLTFAATSS